MLRLLEKLATDMGQSYLKLARIRCERPWRSSAAGRRIAPPEDDMFAVSVSVACYVFCFS